MAKCEVCDKSVSSARRISITRSQVSRRAKRKQKANVRKVKINDQGNVRSADVCTRCLRSGLVELA